MIFNLSENNSHVGMIIHTTTLDTEDKVKAIYGGATWERLDNMFLVGAGALYDVNETGGNAEITLTTDNLPSHNHSVGAHAHGLNSHTHSFSHTHGTDSKGAHQHQSGQGYFNLAYGSDRQAIAFTQQKSDPWSTNYTSSNGAHTHTTNSQSTTTTGGASGNTANSTAFNSGSTGSGKAINNLPPYRAVYIWERTA